MHDRRFQRISTIACLVTSLIAPAALAAGQEPLRSLPTLTVIDGNGQRVGTVISLLTPGWLTKVRCALPRSSARFILSLGQPFAKEGRHGRHTSSL